MSSPTAGYCRRRGHSPVDAIMRDLVDAPGVRAARLVTDAEGEVVEPELIADHTAASSGK